jgi:hypothetical protein
MKFFKQQWGRGIGTRSMVVMAMMSTLVGVGIGSGAANAAPMKKAPLIVGGIFPFTGSKSLLSNWAHAQELVRGRRG